MSYDYKIFISAVVAAIFPFYVFLISQMHSEYITF